MRANTHNIIFTIQVFCKPNCSFLKKLYLDVFERSWKSKICPFFNSKKVGKEKTGILGILKKARKVKTVALIQSKLLHSDGQNNIITI
jgi:hypothetical protein